MVRWLITFCIFLTCPAWAKFYKYSELQVKDHDEMLALINGKITAAKKVAVENQVEDEGDDSGDKEAIEHLREGLRLALSRPNRDNLLNDLIPPLRRELLQYNAFDDTLIGLTDEALSGVSNTKLTPAYRATYFFMLENLMSEMKPDYGRKPDYKKSLEKIRDAKIKIELDVKRELKMTSMFQLDSPSEVAKKILSAAPKK